MIYCTVSINRQSNDCKILQTLSELCKTKLSNTHKHAYAKLLFPTQEYYKNQINAINQRSRITNTFPNFFHTLTTALLFSLSLQARQSCLQLVQNSTARLQPISAIDPIFHQFSHLIIGFSIDFTILLKQL